MKAAYPAKILIAWGEAISGNKKIRDWLMGNGYKELAIFTYALRNKDDARKWLLENGHPHLAATVEGAEGREDAVKWLENYDYDVLAKTARAGDGDESAFRWLITNGQKEMAVVSKKIKEVKDEIERDNNDIHKISKD